MFKVVLTVVGILILVPVVVVVVGLLLPKGHIARTRARYSQGPQDVWSAVSEFARWPEWNPAVQSIERAPDREGKPVWISTGKWGKMPSIVEVFEPGQRMVTRIPADAGLGFTGSWTYELAPAGSGTLVTITETGEVGNPLFRFMGRFFFDPHASARDFLKALGRKLGEPVSPEDAD